MSTTRSHHDLSYGARHAIHALQSGKARFLTGNLDSSWSPGWSVYVEIYNRSIPSEVDYAAILFFPTLNNYTAHFTAL